jgi:hypothetical protein
MTPRRAPRHSAAISAIASGGGGRRAAKMRVGGGPGGTGARRSGSSGLRARALMWTGPGVGSRLAATACATVRPSVGSAASSGSPSSTARRTKPPKSLV